MMVPQALDLTSAGRTLQRFRLPDRMKIYTEFNLAWLRLVKFTEMNITEANFGFFNFNYLNFLEFSKDIITSNI